MYIVPLGLYRALYGRKASEASPAKRSEAAWIPIHITHAKSYTYDTEMFNVKPQTTCSENVQWGGGVDPPLPVHDINVQ